MNSDENAHHKQNRVLCGFLLGVAIGVIFGPLAYSLWGTEYDPHNPYGPQIWAGVWGLVGGILGPVIGVVCRLIWGEKKVSREK